VINGRTSLSPEMAVRVSKAFGSTVEHWMRMQLAYDLAAVEETAKSIKVKRFPEARPLAA
jgi:addiction module HigA family antidote